MSKYDSHSIPVTIRGRTYPNLTTAARKLGVSRSTVSYHLDRGTLDRVGVGRGNHGKQRSPVKPQMVMIGSTVHKSMRAAARALGIHRKTLKRRLERGEDPRGT